MALKRKLDIDSDDAKPTVCLSVSLNSSFGA